MAKKKQKSQAEKAAAASRSKKKNNKSARVTAKKTTNTKSPAPAKQAREIPVRLISSTVCLALFVLFLVVLILPEGALIQLISKFIHGLIGRVGFVVIIPVLLYIFFIHAFSGDRPIKLRTICLCLFTLFCGCISHLMLDPQGLPSGTALLSELYAGGVVNTTGGLLCGGVAMLIKWLCGPVIPYILLILAALLCLLGGMQITIPSIIRAIQNRPRPDWEDDVKEERQEPATVVVNHIANKRIE